MPPMNDVSICALLLKPDLETINSSKNVLLAYFHTITESNYEQFKKGYGGDVNATIPIEGVPFDFGVDANYGEFKDSLKKLDAKHQMTYSESDALSYMTSITSHDANQKFLECVISFNGTDIEKLKIEEQKVKDAHPQEPHAIPLPQDKELVVRVKPTADPRIAQAEIFWGPTQGEVSDVKVTDSKVFIAGELQDRPLLPVGTKLFHYATLPVLLQYKPGTTVIVQVSTDNGYSVTGQLVADIKGFFNAIAGGNVELIEEYMKNGISPNVTNEYGESAFYLAAFYGSTKVIQAMRGYSPDVNFVWSPANSGYTPLMAAAILGRTDAVKELMTIPHIGKNTQDKGGQTALHLACRDDEGYTGNPETVEALVGNDDTIGVNQLIIDQYGWTARRHVKDDIKPPVHAKAMLKILAPTPDAP